MKKTSLLVAGIALMGIAVSSCNDKKENTDDTISAGMPKDFKFLDRANMDTTVKPGDNFFEYANGTWLKNTKIPGDKTRWGSFDELAERTNQSVHTLLEQVSKDTDAKKGSAEYNVATFYKSGMDTATIEKLGASALKPELDAIAALSTTQQIVDLLADNYKKGLQTVISGGVGPDDKDVTRNAVFFGQSGLGLPSKDSYTDKDLKAEGNRSAYKAYIKELLKLNGNDDATAAKKANEIFELENKLAAASKYPAEMRDPQKLYNKYQLAAFSKLTPNIDWVKFFDKVGMKGQDSMIVSVPGYYEALSDELSATPVEVWKAYLTFHTLNDMAPYLSSKFVNARFNFYNKTLSGQKEQEARWKRVMRVINGTIGDQLGKLYVDKYFKPEAKEKMQELVSNLSDAFSERITKVDWMSAETKEKAQIKLKGFMRKIGYPDKWKDYGKLEITDNYAQNVLNSSQFEYNYNINKLGKPVDRSEWGMTPNTVNAYYNPAFNEIVFPAAILQFPFFDFNADDAVNYGGIGAVIGHEMTHGFDDQGAQYAADGNLKNWWTPEDEKNFKAKTNGVVAQFDKYTVLDGAHVNGSLTQGENIADLGGVFIAYQAFKKTKQGQSDEMIDGFTPDQRFFLSWAQVWRGKSTPESLMQQIKTDPHSPSEWRANSPLSNFEPWYKAFNVQPGDKMYRKPEDRTVIW